MHTVRERTLKCSDFRLVLLGYLTICSRI